MPSPSGNRPGSVGTTKDKKDNDRFHRLCLTDGAFRDVVVFQFVAVAGIRQRIAQRAFSDSPGIRGTRSYSQERVRTMPYKVSGTVNLLCDIHSMDTLLGYILGTGPTSSVYSLTDTLPSFYLMIDRVAQVFTY